MTNSSAGLYDFRRELLIKLNECYDLTVSTPFTGKNEAVKDLGVKLTETRIDRRGTNPISDLKLLFTYVKLIKKIKPDVVLTYTIKPNIYGGIACRLTGTKYLPNVTGLGTSVENGGLLSRLTSVLYSAGVKKAACVFFQNAENMRFFIERKIVRGKARLIPGSGVNTENHVYREYPDETDGLRFLFVGRVMKDKGIEELLAATKVVHEHHPNISLDIVGVLYEEKYKAILDEADAAGYINYLGSQNPINPHYARTHCTVLPSYHEGMANVMLESSSTGRPVITTRVPGCAETFDEGITGFGCEAKDVDSLVEAMEKFIALPHSEKERMGRAAHEKMVREFERQNVIDAYLEEIEAAAPGK